MRAASKGFVREIAFSPRHRYPSLARLSSNKRTRTVLSLADSMSTAASDSAYRICSQCGFVMPVQGSMVGCRRCQFGATAVGNTEPMLNPMIHRIIDSPRTSRLWFCHRIQDNTQ
jgi:hypothetical protein